MRYVPPEGPLNAKIAVVGEAPGAHEEAQGRPFVGPSGNLLNAMLDQVGIARSEIYVTNIMKIRPPHNDFKYFYEKGKPTPELEDGISDLLEELERVNPNIIIALGGEPLKALTGKKPISKWRGSLLGSPRLGKILPTYHPGFILKVYKWRAISEIDLRKAREESQTKELNLPRFEFIIQPSLANVLEFLNDIHPHDKLSFDIETSGERVRCLALTKDGKRAICIPFIASNYQVKPGETRLLVQGGGCSSYWSLEDERLILKELWKVFSNPEIKKIAQNFPFDATVLSKEFGLIPKGLWIDTMVAQHCCYSELPKNLDFLTSIYTRIPYYGAYSAAVDRETWIYNCYDALSTWIVAQKLLLEMKELGVWEFYKEFAEPVMIALARAGNRGCKINVELREKMAMESDEKLVKLRTELRELVGQELNPASPKQMKDFLYKKHRLPVQFKKVKGISRVTADAEALELLQKKFPAVAPTLKKIVEIREEAKLNSTFLRSKLDSRGRLLTSYNATGTKNGRISSSTTIFGYGANLQQTPKQKSKGGVVRRVFIPSPGKIFLKADLSQAEARGVAWFSNMRRLIERFLHEPSFDIHRWNSAIIFSVKEDKVTKEQREKGKRTVHGANYGIGALKSSKINKIPYHQAKLALERYYSAQPEIEMWWRQLEDVVKIDRMLKTPFGRIRVFLGRVDEELYRSARAFLPQSTIADIINKAFMRLELLNVQGSGFTPILQIHDEIVGECDNHNKAIHESAALLRKEMEQPIKIENVPEPLLIPADLSIGPNWWDLEDYDPKRNYDGVFK